jgi:predicted transcriptional regulator
VQDDGRVAVWYTVYMVAKLLKDILTRVESWPEREQEEAAASLQAIEEELREPYELTKADKEAIDRGLEAARKGEIATDREVEAVFAKYRKA